MRYLCATKRLRLRRFDPTDTETLFRHHREEDLKKWIPNESYTDVAEAGEAIQFYSRCVDAGELPYVLAIESKADGQMIGDAGINEVEGMPGTIEIGFSIACAYQNKGYAMEAVQAVEELAVAHFQARIVYARIMHGNVSSVKVIQKCAYAFVREELGAEDDPYGNGMLVYRKEI